jgi:hypothetical protein
MKSTPAEPEVKSFIVDSVKKIIEDAAKSKS